MWEISSELVGEQELLALGSLVPGRGKDGEFEYADVYTLSNHTLILLMYMLIKGLWWLC